MVEYLKYNAGMALFWLWLALVIIVLIGIIKSFFINDDEV